MENNITVSLRDWEEKVRDQRSLEILSGLLGLEGQLSAAQVRVICGLQVDKIPDVQPTEPAIWIEGMEEPEDLPEEPKQEELDPHIGIPDNIPHSEDPASPLEGKKKGRVVDRGKVLALHKAGWSNAKIADEMGCHPSRISQILKEER
ncbi:MAG: helix-turn-helix domain-containing protein [Ruminococcus sp.]